MSPCAPLIGPARLERPRPFPSNRVLAIAALGTGAAAFLLRLSWPVGSEVMALQLGYFASYVVLFLAGCLGAKGRWLENVPADRLFAWRRVSLVSALAFPVGLLAAHPSAGAQTSPNGGFNVVAAFYAVWEPLFAWGVILTLLVFYQRRFAALGPLWRDLARRAYLIYIIHPPILVGVAIAMRDLAAPALVKFALAGSAACVLCFFAAGALLEIPAVRRVVWRHSRLGGGRLRLSAECASSSTPARSCRSRPAASSRTLRGIFPPAGGG